MDSKELNNERLVSWKNDQETKNKVFEKLIDWYFEMKAFCGDSIMQNDKPQIQAPQFLSYLADDVIEFNEKWYDDDDD